MKSSAALPSKLMPLRLKIGRSEIDSFAEMSADYNPIHMDVEAAKSSGMTGVIAHGSISLNLLWEAIELSLGHSSAPGLCLDVRFKAPVYLDETVETGGSNNVETGDYDVWVSNQDGLRVIEGRLHVRQKVPQQR